MKKKIQTAVLALGSGFSCVYTFTLFATKLIDAIWFPDKGYSTFWFENVVYPLSEYVLPSVVVWAPISVALGFVVSWATRTLGLSMSFLRAFVVVAVSAGFTFVVLLGVSWHMSLRWIATFSSIAAFWHGIVAAALLVLARNLSIGRSELNTL